MQMKIDPTKPPDHEDEHEPDEPRYDHEHHECAYVPEFVRLKYFYGQMLGANDFATEQSYFREKLKLHNRCLHGYGTVCGLEVTPVPPDEDCESPRDAERQKLEEQLKAIQNRISAARSLPIEKGREAEREREIESLKQTEEEFVRKLENFTSTANREERSVLIRIDCGIALDCEGNELVVRRPITIDLMRSLSPKNRRRVDENRRSRQRHSIYISICYCEQPMDPVRPVLPDACGAVELCTYGKLRDTVRVVVKIDPPPRDKRCNGCCGRCEEHCLLLARIDNFDPYDGVSPTTIKNWVRRRVGVYDYVTITGISWTHGAVYSQQDANAIIGTEDWSRGIEVRFSRPVLTSTLKRGVVDFFVHQGGKGQSGDVTFLDGEFVNLPSTPTTNRFFYRQNTSEDLEAGDRLNVVVRSAFILDECCQPIDGTHVGGRVPIILPDHEHFHKPQDLRHCESPIPNYGRWTSGHGNPGTNFESWFFVTPRYDKKVEKEAR